MDQFSSMKAGKTAEVQGCSGTQTTVQIFPQVPVSSPSSRPCCSPASDAVDSKGWRNRNAMIFGSIAVGLLAGFSGLMYAIGPDVFLREVSSNLAFVVRAVRSILPFFIFSVALSAWVTVSGFSERIRAVFLHRQGIAILGASVVGAIIPICSCGVIPLIAALLASGVPLAPVMAFWLSSPLMSPEMFLLTAGMLGMDYAIARLIAAVAIGAAAGYIIYGLSSRGYLNNQLQGLSLSGCGCSKSNSPPDGKERGSAGTGKSFGKQALGISLFLGKWLLVAFILESLIVHYLDPEWIAALLGKDQAFSIPLATAVGIPLYTSGVAAIPIVKGLLTAGMSHGAAMAFLIAGPVTTIPAMTAVFALVRRQTFLIYLGAGIIGSLATGFVFQVIAG